MGDEVVEARLPEAVVFHPHPLQVQVHRDELEARVVLLGAFPQTNA